MATHAKGEIMITETEWEAIKAEFGEQAFKRVVINQNGAGDVFSNAGAKHVLSYSYGLKLKPLRDLWAHDVSFYIDAYLMWQWRYVDGTNNWTDCNKILSFKADKEYRRKDSAGLPFDFERARKGDLVEFLNDEKKWRDCVNVMPCVGGNYFNFESKLCHG